MVGYRGCVIVRGDVLYVEKDQVPTGSVRTKVREDGWDKILRGGCVTGLSFNGPSLRSRSLEVQPPSL